MDNILAYINQQIESEIGHIGGEPIKTFEGMIDWINNTCRFTGIVSKKGLKHFWTTLAVHEITHKKRNYYLSPADFARLKFKVIDRGAAFTPHAIIAGINTFEDQSVNVGEFYYCTPDEFEVVKFAKSQQ